MMRHLELPPETAVYATLAAVTLMGWALAESAVAASLAATAVIMIAALKIRLVFIHFMELGTRTQPWRSIFEAWTAAATTLALLAYWLASR